MKRWRRTAAVLTSAVAIATTGLVVADANPASAAGCKWTRYFASQMRWYPTSAFDGVWATPVINVPRTAGYCFDINGTNMVTHSNLGYSDHHARFELWIFDGACQCNRGSRPIAGQGWSGIIVKNKVEPDQVVVVGHAVLQNQTDFTACGSDRQGCTFDLTVGL